MTQELQTDAGPRPEEAFYRKPIRKKRYEKKVFVRRRKAPRRIYGGPISSVREKDAPLVSVVPRKAKIKPANEKPFPWPLILSLGVLGAFIGVQTWLWNRQETMWMLRVAWVAACSVLPGFALIAFVGGLFQFRKRRVCSSLAILLCIVLLGTSILVIRGALLGAGALN